MSNQKQIILTELDFDKIKESLKTEFSNNTTFNTYNFDGSGLSVLLNALAYNTSINSYYANVAVNESYLDTALKRANVVSRAQAIGYVPASANAASAIVDVTVTPTVVTTGDLEIERGHLFTATSGGITYSFVNTNATRVTATGGSFVFPNLLLKQGDYLNYSHTVTPTNRLTTFVIPDVDVDLSTMRVRVQTSSGNLFTKTFNRADTIFGLDSTSEVYFVSEGTDGFFNIYFGDGVAGKLLDVGNIILLDYVACDKDLPNGSSVFTSSLPISGHTNILTVTRTVAYGGVERESIESIKRYAPLKYTSQYRVVTASDYEAFVKSNFQGIETIRAWGGEDNNPPIYGKMFMSLKPVSGFNINNVLKSQIRTKVKGANDGRPIEFVEPIYLKIGIKPTVKYKSSQTFRTKEQLQAVIQNNTNNYFNNTLEKFGSNLIMSQLTKLIDSSDDAIIGSSVAFHIRYDYLPIINVQSSPTINYGNEIIAGSIQSSVFGIYIGTVLTYVKIIDNGAGIIQLSTTEGSIVDQSYGKVNYTTGLITLTTLKVSEVVDNNGLISFYASPMNNDILVSTNYIITLDTAVSNSPANIREGNVLPVMVDQV